VHYPQCGGDCGPFRDMGGCLKASQKEVTFTITLEAEASLRLGVGPCILGHENKDSDTSPRMLNRYDPV
jgi:hypothetical protein